MPARRAVAEQHGGQFPDTEEELRDAAGHRRLYGGGDRGDRVRRKRASPVDGNIERVVARLFAIEDGLPAAKPRIRALARDADAATRRAGDFAQAMMDLGATICTPKKPACALCPWIDACAARARGDRGDVSAQGAEAKGKLRRGAAFVVVRADGRVLLRTRPPRACSAA